MVEYLTNVYTTEKKSFRFNIEVRTSTGEVINVIAFNNLDFYDHRRGGYQMYLECDAELSKSDLNQVLSSIHRHKLEVFSYVAPTKIDAVYGQMLFNVNLLHYAFNVYKNLYYTRYSSNFVYNEALPNASIQMLEGMKFQLDPMQEVIHYTSLRKRNHIPEINVIEYDDGVSYLTKNTLICREGEPKVIVMHELNYISITPNCGYIIHTDKLTNNEIIIWLVSWHTLVPSIEINYSSRDVGCIYTATPDASVFYRAMEKLKILEKVWMNGSESLYVEDVKWKLLAFSGKFPCGKVTTGLERIYLKAMGV
jgi:hypothetical protein